MSHEREDLALPSRLPSGPVQGQGQTLLAQGKAGQRLQGVGGLLGERPRQGRPGTLGASLQLRQPPRPPSLPGERLHSRAARELTPLREGFPAATLGRQALSSAPCCPRSPPAPQALTPLRGLEGPWWSPSAPQAARPSETQTTLSSGFLFKSHDWPLRAVSLLRST